MPKANVKEGNRVEKINNAKYLAIINDKEYPIYFTFGLKQELFGIISDAYVKTISAFDSNGNEIYKDAVEISKSISKLEGKEKEKAIEKAATTLSTHNASINIKRDIGLLSDYENMSYLIVSKMLTQRDDEGNPTDEITVNKILNSKDFMDADDVIDELYELAIAKFQETAKKNTNLMSKALDTLKEEKK